MVERGKRTPSSDDNQFTSVTEGSTDVEDAVEEKEFEVYREPILGRHHTDLSITIEVVPPDVVLKQPPKPAAWLSEANQQPSLHATNLGSDTPMQPTIWGAAASVPSVALAVVPVAAAALPTAMWLARRARKRRIDLARGLLRLERGLRASALDPAQHPGVCEGVLRDRQREAERQSSALKALEAEGLEVERRFPWEAREGSQVRVCVQKLWGRSERMSRAAEELKVMAELELLLGVLDSNSGGGHDGEGVTSFEDASSVNRRGSERINGDCDAGGNVEMPKVARLSTRAEALLSKRAADDGSGGGGGSKGTRCVFRKELETWCTSLKRAEQRAVDRVAVGLERWDLKMVDGALAQLRLLELPEFEEFESKREVVCDKWRKLLEEMEEAKQKGNISDLRRVCVKAERFSATDTDEYKAAKASLREQLTGELEVHARRILQHNDLPVDPRCNVALDSTGAALLLGSLGDGAGGNGARRALGVGAPAVGVDRRLALGTEGQGEDGLDAVYTVRGGEGGGTSDGNARGAEEGGGLACVDQGFGELQPLQMHHQHQQIMVTRRTAKDQFATYMMSREEEHRRECEKDRRALEKREDKQVHHEECRAALEAGNAQRAERLQVEIERLRGEEASRQRRRDEHEAQKKAKLLAELRSDDDEFFRLLALADALIAAGAIALKKGFSIAPTALWKTVWNLAVSGCHVPDGDRGVSYGGHLSAEAEAAVPAHASFVPDRGCPSPTELINAAANGVMTSVAASNGGSGPLPTGYDELCKVESVSGLSEKVVGSEDGTVEGVLRWTWSAAGSAARAVVRASSSSVSWLLGQALGPVAPETRCEVFTVLSFMAWLLCFVVVLKTALLLVGGDQSRAGATVRLAVLASFLWGKFHDWILEMSRELALFVAPVPVGVLMYAAVLRYLEHPRALRGCWEMRELDMRPVVSRAIPTVVSCLLAYCLGALSP